MVGPPKSALRLIAENWFAENPYHLTRDSFVHRTGFGSGSVRSPACQRFYDYVRNRLKGKDGELIFPEENKAFLQRIYKATASIRGPYGIVRATPAVTSRKVGDPPAHMYSEIKKVWEENPTARARRLDQIKLAARRIRETEMGQVYYLCYLEQMKDVRRQGLGQYKLTSTNLCGKAAVDVAEQLMTCDLERLGGYSPRAYAEQVNGVYVWYTERQSTERIDYESTRFITDGQSKFDTAEHNAIIMWNPNGVKFPKNVCPHRERKNHGFVAISQTECKMLGIEHIILIDEVISPKDGRQIEKACHYLLDDLPLGKRLHRTPGSGSGMNSTEVDGKRRVVGITVFPQDFFEMNPDIVLVGSANGRL